MRPSRRPYPPSDSADPLDPRSSTSSSFTSLSAKLGETVSELHLALSSLLRNPNTSAPDREDLHLALLGLANKVARNSPYGRIKRALARQLATAVLPDLAASSAWLGPRLAVEALGR